MSKKIKTEKVVKDLKDIPTPKRPKQSVIPLEGKGVAEVIDKKLTTLADDYMDTRDQKATLATKLNELEKKMLDRMGELGITKYRFSDQLLERKDGAVHVKIKTVKVEGEKPDDKSLGDVQE